MTFSRTVVSVLTLVTLVTLATYSQMGPQGKNSFNGFDLVDKAGNVRSPKTIETSIKRSEPTQSSIQKGIKCT